MDCWSCGAERGAEIFCPTCSKIQPLSERVDLFAVLGLERRMGCKRPDIETAFREASRRVHPDRFGQTSSIERKLALRATEVVNQAYRTLRDPRSRAEYLMRLEGVEVGAQDAKTNDPMFLMEMMELGETIDDTRDEDALESMQSDLQGRYDGLLSNLTAYFDAGQGERSDAISALGELRYLRRLVERVDQKLEDMY